uniref:DNA-directed RNA polymerase n=1 Tax=Pithovirus LCPAC102 TaxID=2506587 RepID=A0A481Z5D4_9VIRU|nr:MAG: DNA-directed RNA polymerase subunit beta [Pithovirus LCPAC102]
MIHDFLPEPSQELYISDKVDEYEYTDKTGYIPGDKNANMDNIIDKMITPWPISKVTKPIAEMPQYTGEIKISRQGKLLMKYLEYTGFTRDLIEIYDVGIDRFIERVHNTKINIANDKIIKFDVMIVRPVNNIIGQMEPSLMWPIQAREQNKTYAADIILTAYIAVQIKDINGNIIREEKYGNESKNNISMGKMPVMIGSKYCNLHGLSNEEKILRGECPNDVDAFFIIDGKEYVIISQDGVINNRMIVYPEKDIYLATMTSTTQNDGRTNIVQIFRNPKTYVYYSWIGITGAIGDFRKKSLNIFQIFRILGISDPNIIMEFILTFTKPSLKSKVRDELASTMVHFQLIPGIEKDYIDIATHRGETVAYDDLNTQETIKEDYRRNVYTHLFPQYNKFNQFGELPTRLIDSHYNEMYEVINEGNIFYKYTDTQFSNRIVDINGIMYIYQDMEYKQMKDPNGPWPYKTLIKKQYILDNDSIYKKLYTYSILINRLLEVHLGERKYDDRDSWSNKIIKTSGSFMFKLLDNKWTKLVNNVKDSVYKFNINNTTNNDPTINDIWFTYTAITDDYTKSFKTNWNTGTYKKEEKITDILSRQSVSASYSYITRISSPGSRENPNINNRVVRSSQWGFAGIIDTPENKNTGLVLGKSVGCWVSNERSVSDIKLVIYNNRINKDIDNVVPIPNDYNKNIIMLNGELLGFCNGPELNIKLLELRREGMIEFDVTIIYIQLDNILYISSNSGRPVRPLLLVNEKTQRLILDEKIESGELESEDVDNFQVLVNHGCVEYVCPLTQEYIMLAQSINDLKSFQYDIENTRIMLDKAEQLLQDNSNTQYLSINSTKQSILVGWDQYKDEISTKINTINIEINKINNIISTYDKDLTNIENTLAEKTDINNINYLISTRLNIDINDLNTYKENHAHAYNNAKIEVNYMITDVESDMYKNIDIIVKDITTYEIKLKEYSDQIKLLEIKQNEKRPVLNSYLETQINIIRSELTRLEQKKKYTHCELDPNAIMSVSASLIPLPDHNQGPRNTFVCNMQRQALSIYHSNYMWRLDKTARLLAWPMRPIFETQMNKMLGMDKMGRGEMTILAIMSWLNYNEEDAIIINADALGRGAFTSILLKTIESSVNSTEAHNQTIKIEESFTSDFPRNSHRDQRIYDNLDDRGIAKIGSIVNVGDCIIGKRKIITEHGVTREEDASVYVKVGENGIVDKILYTKKMVKIKIRLVSSPIPGDKFASVHGQKSTIGLMLKDRQMPYIESSKTKPTVIMNPHAIPSRMTLGQLYEMVSSKQGALSGERIDATAYNNYTIDGFKKYLSSHGYNEWGWETMVNSMTGERYKAQIFIGPVYYQRLKHQVRDKAQVRGKGVRDEFSRQGPGGRQRNGALRAGEMERDSIISHGAAAMMQEVYCKSSDKYDCILCTNCNNIAYIDTRKEFHCRSCDDQAKFGKIEIPYSYMLINRYLIAAGIHPVLVTKPEPTTIVSSVIFK